MKKDNHYLFMKAKVAFGETAQITQCVEELCELATALARYLNGKGKTHQVIEELADAEIMLEQMRFYFDPQLIDGEKKFKLDRLQERLMK